jgi:hypothetical protein
MYLDGGYFKKVVEKEYGSTLPPPITVTFLERDNDFSHAKVNLDYCVLDPNKTTILLIKVQSQHSRYQACAFIQGREVWVWNPLQDERVFLILKGYFEKYGLETKAIQHEKCKEGLCNAYTLKYCHDWIHHREFNPTNISWFADDIKGKYKIKGKDQEIFSNELIGIGGISSKSDGVLLGGLGGALVGGAVAGPTGLVLGGLGGALLGGAVSSGGVARHSRHESQFL